jgi:hypothetical protein
VADLHRTDLHRNDAVPWIERELARQMAPVAAPESLWDRINDPGQRRPERPVPLGWVLAPVALALTLLALAGVMRTLNRLHGDPADSAERELPILAAEAGGFDFRSDSLEETRAWVKARAKIDIDVPSGQSPPGGPLNDHGVVRLLGVHLIHLRGLPFAAIDYRIGDEVATLFVSGKHAGLSGNTEVSKHLFSQIKSTGNAQLFSWNMRNQTYMIAFSGSRSPHGACLLCHANMPGLMLLGFPGIN